MQVLLTAGHIVCFFLNPIEKSWLTTDRLKSVLFLYARPQSSTKGVLLASLSSSSHPIDNPSLSLGRVTVVREDYLRGEAVY